MIRSLSRGSVLRILVSVMAISFFIVPIRKDLIHEWSVRVIDENGVPLSGIRITQNWENYTFSLSGAADLYTDSEGKVVFAMQRRSAPAVYWIAKAASNVVGFGLHASFGSFGRVWIADPRLTEIAIKEPKLTESTVSKCSGADCTTQKIESELRLAIR